MQVLFQLSYSPTERAFYQRGRSLHDDVPAHRGAAVGVVGASPRCTTRRAAERPGRSGSRWPCTGPSGGVRCTRTRLPTRSIDVDGPVTGGPYSIRPVGRTDVAGDAQDQLGAGRDLDGRLGHWVDGHVGRMSSPARRPDLVRSRTARRPRSSRTAGGVCDRRGPACRSPSSGSRRPPGRGGAVDRQVGVRR